MLRIVYFFLSIFCFFYVNKTHALQSDWGGIEEAKVRIISPFSKAGVSSNIYLGLEYQLKKGWKTYWRTPGEGGFPQTLEWNRSTNISKLEVLWPTPKEFEILKIKSIGYEDEVIFPLQIKLEDINLPSNLLLDINFLTCKDICISGRTTLQLILPEGQGHLTNHSFQLEKYLSQVPLMNNQISGLEITHVNAFTNNNITSINIKARSDTPFKEPKFFLDTVLGLPVISPNYAYSADRNNVEVGFEFDKSLFINNNFDLAIILKDKNTSIEYKTNIKQKNTSNIFFANKSNFYIFLIALIGGFILNIMPCVLPVLSIKLLSIINNSQASLLSIRKSFIMTSVGIISSFLVLSLILIVLKLGGTTIGWGMQFQQPIFLMIITLILFLFSLNLFGLFEFNLPHYISDFFILTDSNKTHYKDYFNGVFATVLATPCSAPFVGTAVTVAFSQSFLIMVGIFFSMGLGMASPYLFASAFPKSVKLLPKPGSWMNNIKYILGILLLITLGWVGIILNNHFNYFFIIISLFLALIILFSFKYLHKIKFIVIFISIIIFFSLNFISIFNKNINLDEKGWQDLTKVSITNLINKNNIVFVDITADWCVTCQFNKINVINSELINNIFKDNNVIKVRGDWTKPNKYIEDYLNSYSRFGIPFNVMYNFSYPDGIILSELLTEKEIIKTIKKLNNDNK